MQGYQYFRKQPLEFSILFLGYLFFMLLFGLIPHVGQLLAFVFMPMLTLPFMQACREIDQGTRIPPRLLFYGFRSVRVAALVQLGLLYLIAAIIALGASTLIDGGVFWRIMSGQMELTSHNVEGTGMLGAMLFAMLVYLPALMGFWFAGPLIAWQNMSLFKAIFYSFFSTIRAMRAFLIYGLGWFVLAGILPTFFSIIIALITGNPNLILLILMPFSMLLTIILYCTFYPSYKSLFGQATESTMS